MALLKGGKESQQIVAQKIDVVAHGAMRPLRIAGEDRLHDLLVLAHRIGDAVRHTRHAAAIGGNLIAQLSGLIGEEGVAGSLVDRLMERLVDVVKRVNVAALTDYHKTLMNISNFTSPGFRYASGGKPGAKPLQLGHDLEHFEQFLGLDGAYG